MAIKIEGMPELEKAIQRLDRWPKKCVTKAVKKGATIAKKAAKKGGWLDQSREMRKGIILRPEKTKVKGKKVFQITMDAKKNDIFVKQTKAGKRYYYPASQEYGFRTKNGGYVPGFHFLKDALVDNASKIENEIVDVLSKEIDKI